MGKQAGYKKRRNKQARPSNGYKHTTVAVVDDRPFYQQKWFWVCLSIVACCAIVFRPTQIIGCANGSGNGSGCGNSDNKSGSWNNG